MKVQHVGKKKFISHGSKTDCINSNVNVLEAQQLQVASTVTNTNKSTIGHFI